jgi:hypothetical protein
LVSNQSYRQSHEKSGSGSKRRVPPNRLRIEKSNPFAVLGLPHNSSADTVKRKFLQLALQHHPDTSTDKKDSLDTFVKIREAFEKIRKEFADTCGNGKETASLWMTEEDFDCWFYEETGQKMDASARREVMHVYKSGLTRTEYGAVWEIAFILEEQGFFSHKETTLPHDVGYDTKSTEKAKLHQDIGRQIQETRTRRKRSF